MVRILNCQGPQGSK